MSIKTSAERVTRLLERATADTRVILTGRRPPLVLQMSQLDVSGQHYLDVRRLREECLAESAVWVPCGTGRDRLREWVQRNWGQPLEERPPEGTVAIGSHYGGRRLGEGLSPAESTKRLIVAAAIYGSSRVAKHAARFTSHGLIESRQVWLLKGLAISRTRALDEYCILLPYGMAQERLKEDVDTFAPSRRWPQAEDVCALEIARFEDRVGQKEMRPGTVYGSPLLRHGPEHLALLLSLVWGYGFRTFWSWDYVPAVVASTLPCDETTLQGGGGLRRRAELAVEVLDPQHHKPLATTELRDLAEAYSTLKGSTQRRVQIALRRLRDSMARIEPEDMVIDACVTLEALFGKRGERRRIEKTISSRGSWYFADSVEEREKTRSLLRDYYSLRSRIVHGGDVGDLRSSPHAATMQPLRNVLRASIKSMILHGRPTNWDGAKGSDSIWRDPPRSEVDIPSNKAESLSWSVQELREIDSRLERVWKPTVANLPEPAANRSGSVLMHPPDLQADVSRYQASGTPYVIAHPARLYMAHPKWPKRPADELDDRTVYYCREDVARHLQAWRDAAVAKQASCIMLPNRAEFYHPRNRESWPQPLQ